jgi:hypothetical protein
MVTGVGAAVSAPEVPLPQPWDGASRVTILLMGLDYLDVTAAADFANRGLSHSDSMWLQTIGPSDSLIISFIF